MSSQRRTSRLRTRVSRRSIAEIIRSGNAVAGQGGDARGGVDGVAVSVGGAGGAVNNTANLISQIALGGFAVSLLNAGGFAISNNQNAIANNLSAFITNTQTLNAGPTTGGDAGTATGGSANANNTGGNGGAGSTGNHVANGGDAEGGNARAKAIAVAKDKSKDKCRRKKHHCRH